MGEQRMSEQEIASLPVGKLATGLEADAGELEDIALNVLDHGDKSQFRAADAMMRAAHDMRGVARRFRDSTDEPEGDEASVFCKCGHPTYCHVATGISDDGYRHGECRVCDTCTEFRPAPTDEPASGEGGLPTTVDTGRMRREAGDATHADARSSEVRRRIRACAVIALDEMDEARKEVEGVLRNLDRLSDAPSGEGERDG